MYLDEDEVRCAQRPCEAAGAIAEIGIRVGIGAVRAAVVQHLVRRADRGVIVKEGLFKVFITLQVCHLVQIAVFDTAYLQGFAAVFRYLRARLGIYLSVAHLGVDAISCTEDRELRVRDVVDGDIPADAREGVAVEHAEACPVVERDVCEGRVVEDHLRLACSGVGRGGVPSLLELRVGGVAIPV